MGLSALLSFIAEETHDMSLLFLEFEEVAIVAVGFLAILMYVFYVKYPYNKEL
jgi:hypothetical protein